MPSLDDVLNDEGGSNEEVDIDFSGAVDFTPIPDGVYLCEVLDCEPGLSKEDKPKLEWTFGVLEGEHEGRQLKRHTPTTGKGSGLSKQVIKVTNPEVDVDAERIQFKPASAKGKRACLTVGTQKGTDFNEIKRVSPPPGADPIA